MVGERSSKKHRNMGQELIEYAITLPIFIMIVFGIIDIGRAVYYYSAMQNSAREGVRYGVVHPYDNSGVINRVMNRALGLDPAEITVTVSWNCQVVTVNMIYTFRPATPFVSSLFPPSGNVSLSTSSQLQRERFLTDLGEPDYGCVGQ